ncbi:MULTISPECIES: hypothetical protein [Halorubrum]|uniref:Uncharacterized protein n=1 Tax=Halorubrum ruber TaxID=2982524 RepID=A0A8T8LJC5_9EURY|nr:MULTISPECIES: hypothetical protein [Halorubrum]QUO47026.1 hypothetical protein J7656_10500 [Halorubrum ruber]
MNDGASGGRIAFEVDGTTLTVRDVIEGEEMRLGVDREPDLSPALPALFPSPVDDAVSFEAESLTVPEYTSIVVRDDGGEFIGRPSEPMEFPRGSYCIEITGVTKASLRFEDAELSVSGVEGSDPVEVALDRPTTVSLGARSLHTRPEATITVPDDPEALAEAVSVLGSSIREFSAERSWPTLRGYPPQIRRGESLDIPSPLTVPDTGVEVVVRPTYADVYRLSTLAYYLGAPMTIGKVPAVRLDNGYTERLPTDGRGLEERAEELLRTWFFLDTLVRTDGYTLSDREEYDQVGAQLPFYPPNLDELSPSERLMEYMEVDPETVAPYTPEWSTEAVLRPGPASAEVLPHLAHVLAPVRVRGSTERTRTGDPVGLTTADRPTDSLRSPPRDGGPVPDPDADPLPAWTAAALPAGYEHALRRKTPNPGEANVTLLVQSADRAQRLHEALTTPSLAAGVGSLSVLETPTADTVVEVLSDPSIDLLYCDLPLDGGTPVADSDPVETPRRAAADGRSAPAVSVFEGSQSVAIGADAVRRGGTGSAVIDGRIPDDRIRTLVELLASVGLALDTSLATLQLSGRSPVRFAGDSATVVVPPNPPTPRLSFFESVTESEHRLTWRTVLSPASWLGAEHQIVYDCFDDKTRLIGRDPTERPTLPSEVVVDWSTEPDTTLFLNGQFVSPNVDLTVKDVEESARRALAADDSSADAPTELRADSECHD